jgi:REP element-mobilizing transposase RayT
MANTYSQIYIQTVIVVKYRSAVLDKRWRPELFAVIGSLINETGCKTIIVNGVEDHVHCFFGLKPSVSISDVMQNAKAKSSKWLNESGFLRHRFEWQKGFAAFSYTQSAIDNVFRYIQNQETHHRKQAFRKEYVDLLKHHNIEYKDDYLFEELV